MILKAVISSIKIQQTPVASVFVAGSDPALNLPV